MKYKIHLTDKNDLDLIQTLWEKLNKLHTELSPNFKERHKKMTWEDRKQNILKYAQELFLCYVEGINLKRIIGYCITTIDCESVGEIDSAYIDDKYRKLGIGKKLISEFINWVNKKEVKTQKIMVADGNENVLEYYSKFGFFPIHIILQKSEP